MKVAVAIASMYCGPFLIIKWRSFGVTVWLEWPFVVGHLYKCDSFDLLAAASVELLESPDKNQYVLGGYYKKRKERGFQSETNPSTARIYSAMK